MVNLPLMGKQLLSYTHTAYVPCSYLLLLYPIQAALARELLSGVFIDIGTNSLQLVRSGNVHLPKRFIGRTICSFTHALRHHHIGLTSPAVITIILLINSKETDIRPANLRFSCLLRCLKVHY